MRDLKGLFVAVAVLFAFCFIVCPNSDAQVFQRLKQRLLPSVSKTVVESSVVVTEQCTGPGCQVVSSSPVVVSSVPVVSDTVSQASVQSVAVASKTGFRTALLKAAEEAQKEGTISRAQLLKLRVVTLIPSVSNGLQQAVAEQAVMEGEAVSIQAIDWNGLAEFLKTIMPLILQLIDLFS